MKHHFSAFRTAVTGRWAIAFPSFLIIAPLSIGFSLERESAIQLGNLSTCVLVTAAGEFVGYLYLFIAQAVLLSERKEKLQKLSTCVFVWLSTGLVRGLAAALYAHFVLNLPIHFLLRVANSMLFTGISLTLAAFYFGSVSAKKIQSEALWNLSDLLAIDSTNLSTDQISAKKQAISSFQTFLAPKVKQLQELTGELSKFATSEEFSNGLRTLRVQAESLNEKMNEELTAMERAVDISAIDSMKPITHSSFIKGLLPEAISVRTAFVALFFGGIVGQLPRNGFMGALAAIISSLLITTFLQIACVVVPLLKGVPKWMSTPIVYAGVFGIQYFYSSHLSLFGLNLATPFMPWYSATKCVFAVYLASVVSGLLTEQNEAFLTLGLATAKNRIQINELSNSTDDFDRVSLAANFGNLQGKISGVIIGLNILKEGASGNGSKRPSPDLMANTNTLLSEAIWEIQHLGVKELSN